MTSGDWRTALRTMLLVLAVLNVGVVGLLLMFVASVAIAPINPLVGMFVGEFRFENRTDEVLAITPVASYSEDQSRIRTLVYLDGPDAWPSEQQRDLAVAPRTSRRVRFDSERKRLSEVIVRDPRGRLWQATVTIASEHRLTYRPVVVEDLQALAPASPPLARLHERAGEIEKLPSDWVLLGVPLITFSATLTVLIALLMRSGRAGLWR
jgi:hypothetical protein